MSKKTFGKIEAGLNDAIQIAKGEANPATFKVHVPAHMDVKAIRGRRTFRKNDLPRAMESRLRASAIGSKAGRDRKAHRGLICLLSTARPKPSPKSWKTSEPHFQTEKVRPEPSARSGAFLFCHRAAAGICRLHHQLHT